MKQIKTVVGFPPAMYKKLKKDKKEMGMSIGSQVRQGLVYKWMFEKNMSLKPGERPALLDKIDELL